MKLLGKKALVTGAARGIGKGCALELARAGAEIALNDREITPQAEATLAEIRSLGRQAYFMPGNVFERSGCASVVASAVQALGQVDILVSNPAYSRRADFLDYDPETFEKVIQGTLIGGFHMSQLVARHMVERGGGGKIVFISSVHTKVPWARSVAYNAAKSGLNNMALTIATELVRQRINVNVIEPGWIDTPQERETFGDALIEEQGRQLPWGRLGQPEEIGKLAVFLCSGDADYMTGSIVLMDGGIALKAAGAGVEVIA
jgi:glucose 1-dehydrogenase